MAQDNCMEICQKIISKFFKICLFKLKTYIYAFNKEILIYKFNRS